MARDTTFTTGTIVEADYLNADQDKDVGAVWGLKLAQPSTVQTDRIFLENSSYDSRYPIIIEGKRAWRDSPTSNIAATGNPVGLQNIWVHSSIGTLPNFSVGVIPDGSLPSGTYKRKIGTAQWNGTDLYDIKLKNGVQADAAQFNSFIFKSIGQSENETPLSIQGYSTQATSSTKLLNLSVDAGSGTQVDRFSVLGDGRASITGATSSSVALQARVTADTLARIALSVDGIFSWGSGAGAADVTLSRTGVGVLTLGGVLNVPTIRNSTGTNSGRVLIDDILQATGYYVGSSPLDSTHLWDTLNIARLSGTQTFTGTKTFSGPTTFSGVATFSTQPVLSSVSALFNTALVSDILLSNVSAVTRFRIKGSGAMTWHDGSDSNNDATISFSGANTLTLGTTTRLQVPYAATANNDVVNKATMDEEISDRAATKAFTYFMS